MPSQSRRDIPLPRPRPRTTQQGSGADTSNAALLESLGLSSDSGVQIPLRHGAPEQSADSGPLPVFPGYEKAWHQSNDALIREVVAEFNAEKGFGPDHPHYMDPALAKAWALQESGGHKNIFTGGDMMQMNVPGDWAKEKTQFGITGKYEKLDPRKSLAVALQWAWYKGEVTRAKSGDAPADGWHDTQRGTKSVPGYESQFTGWDDGLDGYNGGGVRNYHDQINNRYKAGQ